MKEGNKKGNKPLGRQAVPVTPEAWFDEIVRAYVDAHEAIAFGPLAGVELDESGLFHLAPQVCLKFRGLNAGKKLLERAREAALCCYVANEERCPEVFAAPQLAFAFCYLASHFGLDLLDEETVGAVMDHIEKHGNALIAATSKLLADQERNLPAISLRKPLYARRRAKPR